MKSNEVHIGHIIQSVFEESGMSVSELARRLRCERTNVYSIFKRRTLDVELLAMLSEALNHNFLDDAMRLYGLTATFSPQLNLRISLDDLGGDKMKRLAETLETLRQET